MAALELDLLGIQEVGEEHQRKEGVTQQGEGGKQAEVPQQVTFREQQAQEGAHRGDAAQENGRGFVLQHHFHVSHVVIVDEHVQAVADGYTQHNGTQAQGHQGHEALEPVHAGHGEGRAVGNGEHLLPHKGEAVEAQENDYQDYQQGKTHGPVNVVLDGAGVGNAALRVAVNVQLKIRMAFFVFLLGAGNHAYHLAGFAGVHRVETGGEEGQGYGFVRAEEVTVFHGETADGAFFAQETA